MFNGAYLDSVFGKYGSSLGPGYVFSNGIDYQVAPSRSTRLILYP